MLKLPKTIKEIKKYIANKGYHLQIWEQFGDLVGASIWFGNKTSFGREFYINLNEYGKYAISAGSKRKAYLHAAQKAYWFVKKYLKKVKSK